MSGGGRFNGVMSGSRVERPGAYIDFTNVAVPQMFIGERGTSCGLIESTWFEPNKVEHFSGMDLLTGRALRNVGVTAFDDHKSVKHLSLLLSACVDTRVMSANTGGAKAKAEIELTGGNLVVEAQKYGTFGNDLFISITKTPGGQFTVHTHIKGHEAVNKPRMNQTITELSELHNNDFVKFTFDPDADIELIEIAGVALEGGEDGTVNLATRIPAFLKRIKNYTWQCMGWQWPDETHKALVAQFVQRMRDENGLYVQVSMATEANFNHEAVNEIKREHGTAINHITGEVFTIDEIALMHASMTAGASFVQDNTNSPLPIQLEFEVEFENQEIIDGLQNGKTMFTRRRDGTLKIEADNNGLHMFTPEKGEAFSNNQILRILDEIGTTVRTTWENFFMGNMRNDEFGRELYRADLDGYFTRMQDMGALQNHSVDRILTAQGNRATDVVVNLTVQPVGMMRRLFMTVNVSTGVYTVAAA